MRKYMLWLNKLSVLNKILSLLFSILLTNTNGLKRSKPLLFKKNEIVQIYKDNVNLQKEFDLKVRKLRKLH